MLVSDTHYANQSEQVSSKGPYDSSKRLRSRYNRERTDIAEVNASGVLKVTLIQYRYFEAFSSRSSFHISTLTGALAELGLTKPLIRSEEQI